MAYENAGETEKAVVQYRQLMQRFADKPGAADAAFRLGSLHFKQQRYKEAVEAYQFASKKKMSDELRANLSNNMALCYENLGYHAEAATAYAEVAKYSKDPAIVRESLMNAGLLMKKAEQPLKAIPYFQKLLKDPGEPNMELQAINFLAESQKAANRPADAIQTYERLVGAEPASGDLRLSGLAQLAYMYEQKKEIEKAIRIYEKIAISEGKAEWVKAAQDRMAQLTSVVNAVP
jgi:tetratricopeptide (TPR) repeat protein